MVTKSVPRLCRKKFLYLVLVLCLLTPAVVNFWRGTWYMFDLLFPGDAVLSALVGVNASFGIIFIMTAIEDRLKKFINEAKAKNALYLVLIYLLANLTVASWRGLWMILDHYTTTSSTSAGVSHGIGFLIVFLLKTPRSIIAVPGYCVSERQTEPSEVILTVKHCLRSKTACYSHVLNSFVTVYVIGAGVIVYWRGTWIILSNVTSPCGSKFTYSVLVLGLGYTVFISCYFMGEYLLSFELNLANSLLTRAMGTVVAKSFLYLLGLGVVASWQGIWHLMDIYLLSDQPIVSALVGHFVAAGVLFLSQGSLTLLSPPATCAIPEERMLDGLHLGNFLKIRSESSKAGENYSLEYHLPEENVNTSNDKFQFFVYDY
ncbi:hypothetical protein AWC38_SpisGene3651 [Stylophora pistillata]|uniref:Uncharacterized protein n=1 Tax=Stylophora pistillata TaxID=50429 RepID=A0A2B4SR53_STYPI|nr:hypothetical protein AWC38_SpisGene3651 [Stylophora pistillata]